MIDVLVATSRKMKKRKVSIYGWHRLTPAAARAALEQEFGIEQRTGVVVHEAEKIGYVVYENSTRKVNMK